ncbi:protein kinase [Tenacibaculum dicentrarchi]|nr:protein kinase [Tenacibaculum dicentrarchi]
MGKEKTIIGAKSGANYTIDKEIGKGGQGKVFSIKGGKYAFKLIGTKTSSKSQLLRRKISYLQTLQLNNLPISMPIEQVEGKGLGYIMEMATDMVSLEYLITPNLNIKFTQWWYNTGGLKKRIEILEKIAKTLTKLHAKGLVYGDFSLSNIFVSEDKNYSEIYFIDSDNITSESKVGEAVYTLGYAAPELMQTDSKNASSGYDTYTDNFSFAIIAYQLLTHNHPFIGDYVNEGEPELEESAYLGQIPWVNHTTDNINISKSGIPSSLTISNKMMEAFRNTFEEGIENKFKRTTAVKWEEILYKALKAIIKCEKDTCNQNFFFQKNLICPFCNDQMEYVGIATIHPLLKSIKDEIKKECSVTLPNIKDLGNALSTKIINSNTYLTFSENQFILNQSNKPLFKIKFIDTAIFIQGIGLKNISIISNNKVKKDINITNEIKVNLSNSIILFLDGLDEYQQVLKVKKHSL